ncbi:hypothetical protein [Kitasatospora cineracea]|uniref:hypothetical protein n=1 Tax=Kitasatospora cineracea TaxID=88074 RepID=UPI00380CBE2D
MANSVLDRLDRQNRAYARKACEGVREALDSAGIRLPSLAVERTATGQYLVELGGIDPNTAGRLASTVWAGAPYVRSMDGEEFADAVVMLWTPELAELLVDIGNQRIGEFSRMNESGELVLVPVDGGEPWAVDRNAVRHPRVDDLVQAGIIQPRARNSARRLVG